MSNQDRASRRSGVRRMTLIASVLAMAVSVPLYFAMSQSVTESTHSSLHVTLSRNADASVSVSFKAEAGATYQIYYSDTPATSPDQMQWTLAADNVVAETGTGTTWIDSGDANRPHPREVQQRYYRVVAKLANLTLPPIPSPPVPASSTFQGLRKSLQLARLQEAAELGRLVAGGAQTESELIKKLGETKLSIAKLLELAKKELLVGNVTAAELVYLAIIGPRSNDADAHQLGEAYQCLGAIHYTRGLNEKHAAIHAMNAPLQDSNPAARPTLTELKERYAAIQEESAHHFQTAIEYFLKAAEVAPHWPVFKEAMTVATYSYWELERYEESRRCLDRLLAEKLTSASKDFALWLRAQSFYREHRWREADSAFQELGTQETSGLSSTIQRWRQYCAERLKEEEAESPFREGQERR